MIHFYDSINGANIPSGVYANVYINGHLNEWVEADVDRMARVMRQSVVSDPATMHLARGVDFEPGNAVSVDGVVACAHERARIGRKDFTLYVDEAFAAETGVVVRLRESGAYFRLWVAAWDGNPNARPSIDGVDAWAKQYANDKMLGHPYDLSVLYGHNDFVRP